MLAACRLAPCILGIIFVFIIFVSSTLAPPPRARMKATILRILRRAGRIGELLELGDEESIHILDVGVEAAGEREGGMEGAAAIGCKALQGNGKGGGGGGGGDD